MTDKLKTDKQLREQLKAACSAILDGDLVTDVTYQSSAQSEINKDEGRLQTARDRKRRGQSNQLN